MLFTSYLSDEVFPLSFSAKLFQLFIHFFMPLMYTVPGQRRLSINSAWHHAKPSQPRTIYFHWTWCPQTHKNELLLFHSVCTCSLWKTVFLFYFFNTVFLEQTPIASDSRKNLNWHNIFKWIIAFKLCSMKNLGQEVYMCASSLRNSSLFSLFVTTGGFNGWMALRSH